MEINNFSAAPQRRGESNKARTVARRRSIREQDGGSVSDAPPARCHAEATAAFPSLLLLLLTPLHTEHPHRFILSCYLVQIRCLRLRTRNVTAA